MRFRTRVLVSAISATVTRRRGDARPLTLGTERVEHRAVGTHAVAGVVPRVLGSSIVLALVPAWARASGQAALEPLALAAPGGRDE
jgi:hypothetical protein